MGRYKKSTVYGVGLMGDGIYSSHNRAVYGQWYNILDRCYNRKERFKSYQECTVCSEWLNFQNYADFYYKDEYRQDHWHLDKDILVKNNKIYCPERCVYVPPEINKMFVKRRLHRGTTPIGVFYDSKRNRYKASMHDGTGKTLNLGRHRTAEEAFFAYKQAKELHIKEVAEMYRTEISPRLYNALMNYMVEITD